MKRIFGVAALACSVIVIAILSRTKGQDDNTSFQIVAVRIVEARSVDQYRREPSLDWGTHEPLAVACYCKNHGDWWLFPLLRQNSQSDLLSSELVVRLGTDELPRALAVPVRDLATDRTLQFQSVAGSRVTIVVSSDNPMVGDVSIHCESRGLEIDYDGMGVLLY